jgi:hypothetical protein
VAKRGMNAAGHVGEEGPGGWSDLYTEEVEEIWVIRFNADEYISLYLINEYYRCKTVGNIRISTCLDQLPPGELDVWTTAKASQTT